jgi:GTPase SAR1 family protein
VRLDASSGELLLELAYFGPGLAGKSTNLHYVFERIAPERRSALTSHATDTERLLSFSFLPKSLAPVDGRAIRVVLSAVPGTVLYDASRRSVLDGVDGVVFVADSLSERLLTNVESMGCLEATLADHGRDPADVPMVLQYNKRDLPLPHRTSTADLDRALNPRGLPQLDAIARDGVGVFDTLKACMALAYTQVSTR